MNKIRVCAVSPIYHTYPGGVGRQAKLLTERLASEGVKIFVITRKMIGLPDTAFDPSVNMHKVRAFRPKVHVLGVERISIKNILTSLTFSLGCAYILFKRRKEYDIVHFHGASLPLFVNAPLLRLIKKKVISLVISANFGVEAGSLRMWGLFGKFLIWNLKNINYFIAMSNEIEEGLREDRFDPRRIKRIPNFIDLKTFYPIEETKKANLKEELGLKGQVVTYTGRLAEKKGIDILLTAWKEVIKKFPTAVILILGKGHLESVIKSQAEILGLNGSVILKGYVQNVEDFLRASDIFVFPSFQEGLPNSLLEAMGCGLPVVATRIGGVMDVIKDGENGILVEPGDAQGIAEGITKLLEDKAFAFNLGLEALRTIQMNHSLDTVVQRYLDLYRELIG